MMRLVLVLSLLFNKIFVTISDKPLNAFIYFCITDEDKTNIISYKNFMFILNEITIYHPQMFPCRNIGSINYTFILFLF